jgi:hypothetical protein
LAKERGELEKFGAALAFNNFGNRKGGSASISSGGHTILKGTSTWLRTRKVPSALRGVLLHAIG